MFRSTPACLLLAGVLALGPFAMTHAHDRPGPVATDGTLLSVSAHAEASRVPDIASLSTGVVTQAADANAALKANSAQMSKVVAAIRAAGVAERDVQTSGISIQPQYRYAENQPPVITGYQASNSVSVKFRDIAKSGAILDALVKQGANQIDGPNLSIDRIEAAQDEARVDAVKRARARAGLYAQALGMRVDRMVSLSEGDGAMPGPVPAMMMRAEAKDSTQLLPGEQQVGVTVRVRFLLK